MDECCFWCCCCFCHTSATCISNFHSISTAFLYTEHLYCVVWCCDPDGYRAIPVMLTWSNAGFCFNSDKTILRRAISKEMETDQRIAKHTATIMFWNLFFSPLLSARCCRHRLQRHSFFSAAVSLMVQSHHRLTIKINKYQSGVCTKTGFISLKWALCFSPAVHSSLLFHLYLRPLLSLTCASHWTLIVCCIQHKNTKEAAIVPLCMQEHLSASRKLV